MIVSEYFKTPIWADDKPEWVKDLIKITDPHIKKAKKKNDKLIKKNKNSDFGIVHHSDSLFNDKKLETYKKYISENSFILLDWMGYDLTNYFLIFNDLWVQEFPVDGGGHHHTHIHSNSHITGFIYLKCTNSSSYPVFHDPRTGAVVLQLPEKNEANITCANERIHWKVKPGTIIFTPGYLAHEYVVQKGDPFRFIHFNLQAIPKTLKEN